MSDTLSTAFSWRSVLVFFVVLIFALLFSFLIFGWRIYVDQYYTLHLGSASVTTFGKVVLAIYYLIVCHTFFIYRIFVCKERIWSILIPGFLVSVGVALVFWETAWIAVGVLSDIYKLRAPEKALASGPQLLWIQFILSACLSLSATFVCIMCILFCVDLASLKKRSTEAPVNR